jgi:hypothetical protein
MTSLYKFAPLGLAMLLLAGTSFNSSLLAAQENSEKTMNNAVVKHKIIEVKRNADAVSKIEIEEDGDVKVIELTTVELDDPAMLESKLADLDEDTRAIVMEALNSSKNRFDKGLAFISTQSPSELSIERLQVKRGDIDAINIETDIDGERDVIVLNRGDARFKGVLKGHHKAIINLIEKGEFTRDELNEIRKALDAKF